MTLSIVIPHYNTNSYRERNLQVTLKHYAQAMPNVPIILMEQITPDVESASIEPLLDKYPSIRRYSLETEDTAFQKSTLINRAAFNYCKSDYIAMIDNDCILRDVKPEYLIPSKECSVFIPYTSINFLGESHTRQWVRKGSFKQSKARQEMHISKYTGGINVFSSDTFRKVGGFDEVFVNWGAEDDAFHIKCKRLVGPIERTDVDVELLHVWHPSCKTEEYTQSKPYIENKKRVACIKRMSKEDLVEYVDCRGQDSLDRMGELLMSYESKGKLHIMVKVRVGNGHVTMDSTVYDVDISDIGEVVLYDILECVYLEEGPNFVLGVITQIRGAISDIDTFSESILFDFEERCSVS